jgi:hypothetical protein
MWMPDEEAQVCVDVFRMGELGLITSPVRRMGGNVKNASVEHIIIVFEEIQD